MNNYKFTKARVTSAILAVLASMNVAAAERTELVTVAHDGSDVNNGSIFPVVSANNRYVSFFSLASNLVPGDTNGVGDIFVYDRDTGATERVSVASDGSQANAAAGMISDISADGRYVVFSSYASNMAAGDTNNRSDTFLHDRITGETKRISAGGNRDLDSLEGTISADGRYVAYRSFAEYSPLDTNGSADIYVYDTLLETRRLVSVRADGVTRGNFGTPAISADGTQVAVTGNDWFAPSQPTQSSRDVYVIDLQTGAIERVSNPLLQQPRWYFYTVGTPSVSADGSVVAYTSDALYLQGDTGTDAVYVVDRNAGTRHKASVASDGTPASGRAITTTARALSADGRYVTFESTATNLVADDTNGRADVFVHDVESGTTERVNLSSSNEQANHNSRAATISADGRYVAFSSFATNLTVGVDGTVTLRHYVRDRTNNQAPFAFAGADQLIEATALQTPVVLDGSGSSDPDGDALAYTWSGSFGITSGATPVVNLGLGSHPIHMSVDDGNGGIASDEVNIIVQDTTAPTLSVPGEITVTATGPTTTVNIGEATADDIFTPVAVENDAPPVYPVGTTSVTWSATDANGNAATAVQQVSVVYNFGGFLSPLKSGGIYKIGRTLPVKFQLFYADGSLVTDAAATITVQQLTAGEVVGDPIIVEATNGPDGGNAFTFTDGHYQFNLATGSAAKGEYRIMVDVGDGSPLKMIDIAFK